MLPAWEIYVYLKRELNAQWRLIEPAHSMLWKECRAGNRTQDLPSYIGVLYLLSYLTVLFQSNPPHLCSVSSVESSTLFCSVSSCSATIQDPCCESHSTVCRFMLGEWDSSFLATIRNPMWISQHCVPVMLSALLFKASSICVCSYRASSFRTGLGDSHEQLRISHSPISSFLLDRTSIMLPAWEIYV
jgi:hypothetical protein